MLIKTDGGSRLNQPGSPAAWAFVVYDDNGTQVYSEGGFMAGTCSEAEYAGLINALYWAEKNLEEPFSVRCDSKLVVEQTMGRWKLKEPRMKALQSVVKQLQLVVPRFNIKHIPREKNQDADAICRKVMDDNEQWRNAPDGVY